MYALVEGLLVAIGLPDTRFASFSESSNKESIENILSRFAGDAVNDEKEYVVWRPMEKGELAASMLLERRWVRELDDNTFPLSGFNEILSELPFTALPSASASMEPDFSRRFWLEALLPTVPPSPSNGPFNSLNPTFASGGPINWFRMTTERVNV